VGTVFSVYCFTLLHILAGASRRSMMINRSRWLQRETLIDHFQQETNRSQSNRASHSWVIIDAWVERFHRFARSLLIVTWHATRYTRTSTGIFDLLRRLRFYLVCYSAPFLNCIGVLHRNRSHLRFDTQSKRHRVRDFQQNSFWNLRSRRFDLTATDSEIKRRTVVGVWCTLGLIAN
jgi:hypothetical protein